MYGSAIPRVMNKHPEPHRSCSCVPNLRIQTRTSWLTIHLPTAAAATGRYRCRSCRENCVGTCWRCTTRERANRLHWETLQCLKRVEEPCNWLATHMKRSLLRAKKTGSCASVLQASNAFFTIKGWNRREGVTYHRSGRNPLSTLT